MRGEWNLEACQIKVFIWGNIEESAQRLLKSLYFLKYFKRGFEKAIGTVSFFNILILKYLNIV